MTRGEIDDAEARTDVCAVPEAIVDGWQTGSLNGAGLDPAPLVHLVRAIREGDFLNIFAILLVRGERLVLEEYFNGFTRDRLQEVHSISKSVTSLLIGIAIDRGIIPGIDTPVHGYFLDHAGTQWIDRRYGITIKDLLTMSAGVDWDENSLPRSNLVNSDTAMQASEDWIGYVLDRKRLFMPGRRYNYSGGLTILLGELLRRASGLSVGAFAETHLFAPLGIARYHWKQTPRGTVNAQGGWMLAARDAARIGAMVLAEGRWHGRSVVSRDWIRRSTRAYFTTAPRRWEYGYHWHRYQLDTANGGIETHTALGQGGQFILVLPRWDLAAVFFSETEQNEEREHLPLALLRDFIAPAVTAS